MRHPPTSATRSAAFPVDEPLDEQGRTAASRLSAALPRGCEVLSSPALRCRETVEAAGLEARLDAAVAECDFGRWAGATLQQVRSELHAHDGRWTVTRLNHPVGPA